MRTWSDTVNMVNAPYLAKERGIAVREIRNEGEGDYHTLVAVTVGTEQGEKRVEGTLFGNRAPRLVKIFGIPVEAELAGQMIYIVNTDAAGLHRRARHQARREPNQHRDLQPRPPQGRRAKPSLWSRSTIRSRRESPGSCTSCRASARSSR